MSTEIIEAIPTYETPDHHHLAKTQLRAGTLSLFDTTAVAVASVAPAYSLAATVALLVAAVGNASPAAILVSFFPVLAIALAYNYMNQKDPDCGASYTWVSRTVSPFVGWFNGWVQTAASVLFCIAAPVLAGGYTLSLLNSFGWISSDAAGNTALIAIVGLLWLVLVTAMVVYGIRLTANFQWVMLAIEYLTILAFSIAALVKVATVHPAGSQAVQLAWFNPFSLQGVSGLAAGAVLGVFFFWGWDTAANLNEESRDAPVIAGQAGIISMFILLFIFLLCAAAVQALLPASAINKQSSNVLFYFANQIVSTPWSYVMILAVLTSTVATTQTTLLPASRVTFSMARQRVFPAIFGTVHPSFKTPWLGTLILAAVSAAGIVLTSLSSTVNSTFANLIANIGVLVAVYYGLTGVACAWAYRRVLTHSVSTLLFAGLFPLLGGLFLFWIGYQVVVQSGIKASLPILVTLILGIPLVILARVLSRGEFFHTKAVSYDVEREVKAGQAQLG